MIMFACGRPALTDPKFWLPVVFEGTGLPVLLSAGSRLLNLLELGCENPSTSGALADFVAPGAALAVADDPTAPGTAFAVADPTAPGTAFAVADPAALGAALAVVGWVAGSPGSAADCELPEPHWFMPEIDELADYPELPEELESWGKF